MRDVPQLKFVREEKGWSQRDLAARSGVAQNTISQLERGERQAMPSTIRKLAEALNVGPHTLLAETTLGKRLAAGQLALSLLPPEHRAPVARQMETIARSTAAVEAAEDLGTQQMLNQALEEWEQKLSAVHEHEAEIKVARSKIGSGDSQDVLEVAELAKRKLYDVCAVTIGFQDALNPDSVTWRNTGGYGPDEYKAQFEKQYTESAKAAQEWLDLYKQCLDWLDDEITMRRGEVTALEAFVRRSQQRRVPNPGESAPDQKKPPSRRHN